MPPLGPPPLENDTLLPIPRLHCDRCRAGLVDAHSTNPVRHLPAIRLHLHGSEADQTNHRQLLRLFHLTPLGVSLIDTRGLHVDKTRSKLCSHGTDLNIIGRTEMGDFRNGRSLYLHRKVRSFIFLFRNLPLLLGVIFYHTIFALHGFDFRACLQVHTAVLCARTVIPRKIP